MTHEVKLIDNHPGMHQNGVKVVLCKAKQVSFAGEEAFLTGFRKEPGKQIGMFNEDEEPLQVIERDGE